MDLSKLVSSLRADLKYDYNLLTKIGPVSRKKRGNDRSRYNVQLEFSGVQGENGLIDTSRCYMLEVDFALLPVLLAGHVWTKQDIYQNPHLNRKEITLSLKVEEQDIYSKSINEILGLPENKEERKSYLKKNKELPLSYRMTYSRCYQFNYNSTEEGVESYDYVLIPAYEVLRFLFFKSEDLVEMVFNHSLSKHCQIGTFEQEDPDDSNTAIIVTDKKYDIKEEYILASIFYNKGFMRTYNSASSYINKVLMNSPIGISEIAAVFPSSIRTIYACGFPIVHEGRKYFYVYQIYSVLNDPGFDNLMVISRKKGLNEKKEVRKRGEKIENSDYLTSSRPKEEIEISNSAAANDRSIRNRLDFSIETVDKFGNENMPDRIVVERPLDDNSKKRKKVIIHKKSGMFTLNLERSKDSEQALASIFADSNSETQSDLFQPILLKVLEQLRGEAVYSKFFNCIQNDFSYKFIINPLGEEKNIKALVIKIFKGKKEKILIDFTGIYSTRIVAFYKENLVEANRIKLKDFLDLVLNEMIIPRYEDYLCSNINKNQYEEYRWDRLNIGSIDEKSLKERILKLLE